jgi:hypothetical protein
MLDFTGPGAPLTAAGVSAAGDIVRAGLPELWAVISVETSGCGFLADRRPKILFERHVFCRLTGGRFDADDPDVSQPSQGGYGPSGAHQYERLAAAMQLDPAAALASASWGLGQIMGENFKLAGFDAVEAMVSAMVASEDNQLRAMAAFVKGNGMDQPLAAHDWAGFARRYNGPNYAANNYDGLLQHFYERYAAQPPPDLRIRAAQVYLSYRGFPPGGIDGIAGPGTERAVRACQASLGTAPTGIIDDALLARLSA